MKRFALLGSVSLILSAAALQAQSSGRTCSNQTLRGAYGVLFTGTAAAASVLPGLTGTPGSIEQTTGVVIHTFDGFGQFTQTDTVKGSLSGTVADRPGGGTYSVNADCSGTYSIIIPFPGVPPIVVRFVIVDSGKEFRGIVMSPQSSIVVANGRKVD